eukprot:TRINITY_DN2986_c0_g1_i2.p1 TRINITY_DN2986_c0_g1~~TRINITY_DN2986_c0_g1_i2.p1  ORF type:complete len:951 (+),score=199.26 TRINITY_DN2986_c0_g1_i2:116-2968(+)
MSSNPYTDPGQPSLGMTPRLLANGEFVDKHASYHPSMAAYNDLAERYEVLKRQSLPPMSLGSLDNSGYITPLTPLTPMFSNHPGYRTSCDTPLTPMFANHHPGFRTSCEMAAPTTPMMHPMLPVICENTIEQSAEVSSDCPSEITYTKIMRHYTSGRPIPGHEYFSHPLPPNHGRDIGIVIPVYNEGPDDLAKTLESLSHQFPVSDDGEGGMGAVLTTVNVVIVVDGWNPRVTHPGLKAYLQNLFPSKRENGWVDLLEANAPHDPRYRTAIVQNTKDGYLHPVHVKFDISSDGAEISHTGPLVARSRKMYVSLIVKRDNRKKYNSHEWAFGFNGFVDFYKPRYILLTDCGTLFQDRCVAKLHAYMDSHDDAVVVTCRQRVMSRSQQGSKESLLSMATWYRLCQLHEYEGATASFMAAFAAVGFLPVVPGPCGLYRTSMLCPYADEGFDRSCTFDYNATPAGAYFDTMNTDPSQMGLVSGNLQIAEDRLLTYFSVLKANRPAHMGYIPDAVFYFEAETNFKNWIFQRRRWINGTWAGYFFLVFMVPQLILANKHIAIPRRIAIWSMLALQLLVHVIIAVTPGICIAMIHLLISTIVPYQQEILNTFLWASLVVMYFYFVIRHHTHAFEEWLFSIFKLLSVVITAVSVVSFALYVSKHTYLIAPSYLMVSSGFDLLTAIASWSIIVIVALPILLALVHNPKSAGLMLISLVPYYLFIPMTVAFFASYAFARSWDLSWGNRPQSSDPSALAELETGQEAIRSSSRTLTAWIVLANIIFFFVEGMVLQHEWGVFILACLIFGSALIQMAFSLVWFIVYDVHRFLRFVFRGFKRIGGRSSSSATHYASHHDPVPEPSYAAAAAAAAVAAAQQSRDPSFAPRPNKAAFASPASAHEYVVPVTLVQPQQQYYYDKQVQPQHHPYALHSLVQQNGVSPVPQNRPYPNPIRMNPDFRSS